MRKFNKIFQIGYPKTGTTSLFQALIELGIPTIHWWEKGWPEPKDVGFNQINFEDRWNIHLKKGRNPINELGYDKFYDAFTDRPFNRKKFIYKLPIYYPDSLFIYLERDMDTLWDSRVRWVEKVYPQNLDKVLNSFDEYPMRYNENKVYHEEFLSTIPSDNVLKMNICDDGDGWEKLCTFLDMDILSRPFPHSNNNHIL